MMAVIPRVAVLLMDWSEGSAHSALFISRTILTCQRLLSKSDNESANVISSSAWQGHNSPRRDMAGRNQFR